MQSKHRRVLLQKQARFFVTIVTVRHQNLLLEAHWLRLQSLVEINSSTNKTGSEWLDNQPACLPKGRKYSLNENITSVRFLIDKSNKCSYNKSIATLGKMLNSNSNNRCMVSLTFPFNWPSYFRRRMTMQKRLEIGSHVFIIESNRVITEVVVTANRGISVYLDFHPGGCHSA